MRIRFILVTIVAFSVLLLCSSPASADKARDDVVWILGLKRVCDLNAPGFREKSAGAYAEWRQSKIDIIREIEREPNFQAFQAEKRALTPQEQAEIESFCVDDLLESLHAPDLRLSTPEKTWVTFSGALRNADRELALSCLTSNARNKFKPMLQKGPEQNLVAMANSIKSIEMTMGFGPFREAAVVRHDGKAGLIYFQDVGGEWKISEM